MSFPTLDQSLPWTKKTNRTLENELSNIRSIVALNQENESNSWNWAFQRSISRCPEPSNVGKLVFKSSIRFLGSGQRLIECWKAHFQEFDSFSWFRARTDRMLERSFSRVRFVFLVQGKDWSNVGKLVFKSSIRLLGSGQRLIECWKARFQEFDSFSWFRATTDRMLESSFSRVRFVFLVQGKDWSNVGKLVFKSSIRFLGSGQRLKKTNRTLENELSNIRSVVALNQENESNSWKRAFQHSISPCPEPRKRIELLKMSFPTFDQSLPWTIERYDWSNVGKLIFKSSIRFLGSGQRLIECWKARFQEFDSFSWFRATTDRMLESSFSRVRFVFLVQGNDWRKRIELLKTSFPTLDQSLPWTKKTNRTLENELSNIRSVVALNQENESNSWKRAFQHSISRCPEPSKWIELLKMSFPTFDQSLPWTKKTNRTLENELSNIRSVVALNQENESNSWKWAFQRSISRCPEPRKRIELLKTSFPTFDQSLPWTKKTNRTLENELSNTRSVVALNQENESNSWKWAFQCSISRCPEPRKRIELLKMSFPTLDQSLPWTIERWKAHFQEFDSFSWFRARTDRALESSFSRVRFVFLVQGNDFKATTDRALESSFSRVRFVFLVQGNDWSSVGKLIFKSSIRFLGSGQRLIECWKAHFQEFDSFSWFRATTDRMLESSFSRVRFVFLVQGNDWSNVGKLIFKSSIHLLGSGQRLIERWKAHFQEFDSFSRFRATTDRMLESSFSRVRFVFLVQGKDWSSVGKLIFKSSIRLLGSGQRLIERWKARFQEFDSFSWFRATTDRMLESSFSRVRFVFLVQGNDWSNVGKLIFKSSIRFLGSGQRLIECWKAHFQEFDSFSWFRATTDRMLESSFSRVRFVFLVQSNDWSNVGKLVFKSSIRFLGSGQGLIECWKARFQEFDSFSWFRATTDRMLESSFSRVRFVFLVQGNDWSNVGKIVFKSSIRFLGSGQGLIECWKAHFQEFDSFTWFRATTDRMLESSFSRVRFVFLVQGNDWSNVGKFIFKSSIRFLGSGQGLIECWKAHFQEFDSFSWFRATTDRALESSFSRVRFVSLVQGKDWSSVGKLIFKSSIRFLGSGQRLQGNEWSSVEKLVFKSSIQFLGSGQRLIERWKAHFQEFDSFSWFRATTDRMLESSFSRVRFVFLVQGNDWSNVGKLVFKSSIRFLGSGQRLKKTNRTLENELSNIRSVVALNQENESNSWKRAFQHSISRCPEPRKRIELLKTSFPTFDQSLPWTIERYDWSNVGKLIFKSSIRFLGSGQRLIECWKARFQEFDSFSWFRATTDRMLESSFSRVRFVYLVQGNDWRKRIELLKTSFPTLDQSLPWTK